MASSIISTPAIAEAVSLASPRTNQLKEGTLDIFIDAADARIQQLRGNHPDTDAQIVVPASVAADARAAYIANAEAARAQDIAQRQYCLIKLVELAITNLYVGRQGVTQTDVINDLLPPVDGFGVMAGF